MRDFSSDQGDGHGHRGAQGGESCLLCICTGEGDSQDGLDEGVDGVGHGVLADHGDNGC